MLRGPHLTSTLSPSQQLQSLLQCAEADEMIFLVLNETSSSNEDQQNFIDVFLH